MTRVNLDLKLTSGSMLEIMKRQTIDTSTSRMLGEPEGVSSTALQPRWSIGEASARTGVSVDTLRYYERVGLAIPAGRTSGGARRYSELDLEQVSCTKWLRDVGVSIPTIVQYIALRSQGVHGRSGRRALLADYRDELLRRRIQLDTAIDAIEDKIAKYDRMERNTQ